MQPYKALVVGGSGHVGKALLRELIKSSYCHQILYYGRSLVPLESLGLSDMPMERLYKLRQISGNLDFIEKDFQFHRVFEILSNSENTSMPIAAFNTLGTRYPTKLSESEMYKVDVEYPTKFAQLCKQHTDNHATQGSKIKYFGSLSYIHANAQSSKPIQKIKGIMEKNIKQMRFENSSFFRPTWIRRPVPQRADFPNFMAYLVTFLKDHIVQNYRFFFPVLYFPARFMQSKYHSIDPDIVAKSMVMDARLSLAGKYAAQNSSENGGNDAQFEKWLERRTKKRIGSKGVYYYQFDDMKLLARKFDES